MEIIFNHHKYGERTLSDEQIEHRIDYAITHKQSMAEMMREKQYNEADKKAIEEHFEKRVW